MNPPPEKTDAGFRTPSGSREEIVAALFELFRRAGYDGVSLADISAATGLGKSSLYYHFPGGKPDMAEAVCSYALTSMRAKVFEPLGAKAPLAAKVDAMLATADAMYGGGTTPCLVANMLPSGAASAPLRAIISEWIDALAGALTSSRVARPEARRRAVEAVVAIEGALIVTQATGDKTVFADSLAAARRVLLAGD
jgi:AcrR family transcriptional regulator